MKVWFESNPNGWIVARLLVISFYGGVVRLLREMQIDVDEDYRNYLQDYPPGGPRPTNIRLLD